MKRTKEQLEADIKCWKGLNKYIVEAAELELKELKEPAEKEPESAPAPEAAPVEKKNSMINKILKKKKR